MFGYFFTPFFGKGRSNKEYMGNDPLHYSQSHSFVYI